MKKNYGLNIGKMYAVRFMVNMYFISAVIVPFYTEWGGIKFSQILFLNAWFMFWNFLLEIPTGTIADFLGRKVSLVMGCGIGVVAALVYVSHPSLIVFSIGEIFFALSYTLLSGADEALAYDSLIQLGQTRESKKVLSRMTSFKLAGIVIGAASGGVIAKTLGLHMPMLLLMIPLAVAGLVSMTFKEPPVSESQEKPIQVRSFRGYREILTQGIQFFWRNKILKLLTLDMVVVCAFTWIIIWFYQALLQSAGIDIAYFGVVHSFMSIVQIFFISSIIRIEKWLGSKKRLLFFSAFIPGGAFILLGSTNYAPLVITGILFSAGFGLSRQPIFSSYMNKYIPSDKRATILSTTSMLQTFSIVIVDCTAGLLADWSIPMTLWILGGLLVVFSFVSRLKEEHLLD